MLRSLRLTRPLAAKHLRACSLSSKPKKAAASLGVVRLDYDYESAPGDIDDPRSSGTLCSVSDPIRITWVLGRSADPRLIPDPVFARAAVSPRCPRPRV